MPLETNRQHVLAQIRTAEATAHRVSGSVQLIAVSKTFPADDIRTLYQHGQRDFGENYIQEWHNKTQTLADCPEIQWHIIGHVQSNKSRPVAEHAHWLHTLDRTKLAQRLSEQRPDNLPDLQVLIEINIANEAAKHGIAPEELLPLARIIVALPKLNLRGLMCVAQADADETKLRRQFSQMQDLLAELQTVAPQADTLSMGMSSDMAIAIECGATMVRVGSAIFGKRDYAK
ncbi:YggS family pyridoxal phosphate-dependent enzyme [Kingella negevensis]|uniref:YggS family pyridoxal phosphate-dependent enzyme n=1 Tax=Kingella negevensis TaxID=1522312 RepID=UPI00050A01C7|nr:YggS family pyridoxal phosphate-dependent enzyme [Kingella negevensis]MDK4688614.1 YggS family pyridoxal phosphate-dependent enzyme [Kingella negevensis]WII91641.1 YggS family pyridoxal phosphate-dependent enzyme [Kingella negevensis]